MQTIKSCGPSRIELSWFINEKDNFHSNLLWTKAFLRAAGGHIRSPNQDNFMSVWCNTQWATQVILHKKSKHITIYLRQSAFWVEICNEMWRENAQKCSLLMREKILNLYWLTFAWKFKMNWLSLVTLDMIKKMSESIN